MWKSSRSLGSQAAVVNKEGFLTEKAFEFSSQGQEVVEWQEGDGFRREDQGKWLVQGQKQADRQLSMVFRVYNLVLGKMGQRMAFIHILSGYIVSLRPACAIK